MQRLCSPKTNGTKITTRNGQKKVSEIEQGKTKKNRPGYDFNNPISEKRNFRIRYMACSEGLLLLWPGPFLSQTHVGKGVNRHRVAGCVCT